MQTQCFLLVSALVWSLGAPLALAQDAAVAPAPTVGSSDETPPALPALPGDAVTLETALAEASNAATDPVVAALQISRAQAAERMALGAVLPFVNGSGNLYQYDSSIERAGSLIRGARAYDINLQVGVNLSGRALNALSTTAAQTRVAEMQSEDAQRLARATAAKAFFAVLAARRNAEILRSQYAAAVRQDAAVAVRVEVGTAVPLDRARSQLAVLDISRRIVDADAQLQRSWDVLGLALGRETPVNATDVAEPEQHESLGDFLDRAMNARPDLRALHGQIEVAEHGVDDAWWRFGPTLGISWSATYRGPTTLFSPDPSSWTALATLTVPFFDGGVRYGAIRDARAAVEQARVREAALGRSIRADVRDAFRRVESTAQGIEIASRSADVARSNAARAEAAFAAGASNGIELDDARRNLEQAEITLLLRRLDRQIALIDLLTAAGQL